MYAQMCKSLTLGTAVFAAGSLCALPISHATAATTVKVTNCNDTGPGSLRDAAARAATGDVIDLRTAGCSRIKLAGQPITLPQAVIRIIGPGRYKMVIDGDYKSSVLRHTGSNTLWVQDVSVEHGAHKVYAGQDMAQGGCIYSNGVVRIDGTEVRHCGAYGTQGAQGGGIFAARDVNANSSAVFSNDAVAFNGRYAYGGGIYARRAAHLDRTRVLANSSTSNGGGLYAPTLQARYSTFANNYAKSSGGGIYIYGFLSNISNSTISGNAAEGSGGGMRSGDGMNSATTTITNSTISNNRAASSSAVAAIGELMFAYSTVAFNETGWQKDASFCSYAAVSQGDSYYGQTRLDNSILSNNTCAGKPALDISWVDGSWTVAEYSIVSNPQYPIKNTISDDPKLQPLANNGGPTLTHALGDGSPAIDIGTNLYSELTAWDQRGPGYPRLKGNERDAGAYER